MLRVRLIATCHQFIEITLISDYPTGALNLTRDAKRRSDDAVRRANDVQKSLSDSERQRRRIDALLNQIGPQMNRTQEEVAEALKKLDGNMGNITASFPDLNTLVCDRGGDPCDSHCGGAGCGKCGGLSCEGAVTNADNALKYAQDAYTELKRKDADAEDLLRTVFLLRLRELSVDSSAISTFHIDAVCYVFIGYSNKTRCG